MKKTTVLILAGGQSRRMGKNKALLPYNDRTMIEEVIESVKEFDEILLVTNQGEEYEYLGLPIVEDVFTGLGPMAGIHAGLSKARNSWCLVLPCDTPYVNKDITTYLSQQKDESYHAVISLSSEGKWHPLLGLYHKKALIAMEKALKNNNLRLISLLEELRVKKVHLQEAGFMAEKILMNINTPKDYRRMKTPPVLAISGVSNSGKTTVLVKLISKLKSKGYSLGTIKHDGHDFEMDHEGKDTYAHREAGADGIIIASAKQYAMIKKTETEIPLEHLISLQSHYDLILLEGFKFCDYPKIEVVRQERSSECVCNKDTLLAVVTDVTMPHFKGDMCRGTFVPQLALDNTEGLFNVVENYMKEYHAGDR